jgi:ketosteroid isomerase-like protein
VTSRGCFELTALEVTAGSDVAFAHALLRCGTRDELTWDPDHRLRLTLGLRKEKARWCVSHEHHSFPDTAAERDTASSTRSEPSARSSSPTPGRRTSTA